MSELPENWKLATIGEIGRVASGGTPSTKQPSYYDGEIPWVTPKDLSGYTEKFISHGARSISKEGLENSSAKLLPKGTVLFSSRAPIGYCAIATDEIATNQGFKNLIPAEGILAEYVYHYLKGSKQLAEKHASGTTFLELSAKAFSKLPIPVAPLPEQRRIVARIEELFSRLDAAVAALRHAKAQLQRYRQSVLAAAVTGQLTREWREKHSLTMDDWHQTTLGNESTLVTSGSRGWAKYYADDGPLFVRAQNIKTDALVLDDLAHVRPPAGAEGARTQVFENDLLITITGANVTKSARVEVPLGEAYVSQHVALVRPSNPAHAPFLYYAIVSPRNGRAFLEEKAYGAGKPGLNLTNVREVPIGLPPLAEQHQIVADVEARTTAIDHLEAELDRQITRSNRLRQVTLAAAFGGKLA